MFDAETMRRLPDPHTYDYSLAFNAVAPHFVPEDSDCLITTEALAAAKEAKAELRGCKIAPDVIEDMFSRAGEELRQLHFWLSMLRPEDFSDQSNWL